MSKLISMKAYAKINLYLDVLGRRSDGYHEILSVMQSVSLYDELTISEAQEIEIITSFGVDIPREENLIFKAARLLQKESGLKKGAKVEVRKMIPMRAGLGGGSSDAAAALVGLNQLWGLGFDLSDLTEIAKGVGSDVPFMVRGGTALVQGRGEMVSPLSISPTLDLIIIKPTLGLSTAQVYAGLGLVHPPAPPVDTLLRALSMTDLDILALSLFNRLEGPAIKEHPILAGLKEEAIQAGAKGALMTGSGSAIFALADSALDGQIIAAAMKGSDREVFTATTLPKGCDFRVII